MASRGYVEGICRGDMRSTVTRSALWTSHVVVFSPWFDNVQDDAVSSRHGSWDLFAKFAPRVAVLDVPSLPRETRSFPHFQPKGNQDPFHLPPSSTLWPSSSTTKFFSKLPAPPTEINILQHFWCNGTCSCSPYGQQLCSL